MFVSPNKELKCIPQISPSTILTHRRVEIHLSCMYAKVEIKHAFPKRAEKL